MDFVHLHTHSDYSILDSTARIPALISKARELGMKHLGLTDRNNLFGALIFEQNCRLAGINPVLGCEISISREGNDCPFPLVLYCKNVKGYRNLLLLVSESCTGANSGAPWMSDAQLRSHHKGLICSSAGFKGEISRHLTTGEYDKARERALFYHELFGDGNFYLEVTDHGHPEEKEVTAGIRRLSRETGIPVIATNNVHYVNKYGATFRAVLAGMEGRIVPEDNGEYYFKTAGQMTGLFQDFPEALENTVRLAEKCDLNIPQPGPILPDYQVPEPFESRGAYLTHLTREGLKERYGVPGPEVTKRADEELDIILSMGFEDYFLVVWDYIRWSRQQNIPVGPGRGSAPGSIVAYALKITGIDPLKYRLLFERFVNPERVTLPDIDTDFCRDRRDEVIDYLYRKYGSQRVAGISTFPILRNRFSAQDVVEEPDKVIRKVSPHACGRIIGATALTDYVPLHRDRKTGEILCQFSSEFIEYCGPVRFDFLGLKTLTQLRETERLIQNGLPGFDIETIPEEDEATFQMLSRGDSSGVFQFESPGMQEILREAQPGSIEDLMALNALYRPGPMQNLPRFIEGKMNPATISYPHPALKDLLASTYGVYVYQEQIMETARIIGGFSLGKGDLLRRALGKMKIREMERFREEFLTGARKKGYDPKLSDDIYCILKAAARYSFNKSHAAAYTTLAYRTAYCKANFPAAFQAAMMHMELESL